MSDLAIAQIQWRTNPYGGTFPTWTYGNWGGLGWSAGKFTKPGERPDFEHVEGMNELDNKFKEHDKSYWDALVTWKASAKTDADIAAYWKSMDAADVQLRQSIKDLGLNKGWDASIQSGQAPDFEMANAALQADSVFALKEIYNKTALKNLISPDNVAGGIDGDPSSGLLWPGAEQGQEASNFLGEIVIIGKKENITTPTDSATRNSANYITDTSATDHLVVIKNGGKVWDAFVSQKNADTGFKDWGEFKAAVAASNPGIADLSNVKPGQTIYLPEKLPDGSITYNYSNGVSINSNAITGEYHMVVPNEGGGQTIYSRSTGGDAGYVVKRITTDQSGTLTSEFIGHQETLDGPIIPLSAQVLGTTQSQKTHWNAGGGFQTTTSNTTTHIDTAAQYDTDGHVIGSVKTEHQTNTAPSTDTVATTLQTLRDQSATHDSQVLEAAEIRNVLGTQGKDEAWGGGRILVMSHHPLAA